MLEFTRLGIILTEQCNQNCKYCYKDKHIDKKCDIITDEFINYIRNLSVNNITKNVCVTGGEPLLKIKEMKLILDNVPESIPKKVTTNGLLLTNELVDYFNETNTCVHISHDGKNTLLSRGYDIFTNLNLLKMIKRIKNLMVYYTLNQITYTEESISDYIANVLERDDFTPALGIDIYSKYNLLQYCFENKILFTEKYQKNSPKLIPVDRKDKRKYPIRINITTDGNLWSMTGQIHLGNFKQSQDELDYRIEYADYPDYNYCKNNQYCRIRSKCEWTMKSSPDFCKYQEMIFLDNLTKIYI